MAQPLFSVDAPQVARVALPVPIDELFEYAIPTPLVERARPGCRVRVRFRDRIHTGVIVERSDEADFQGRLRAIESVIDEVPALSQTMLEILVEAARQVLCPVGIALATALPAGSAPRAAKGYEITPRGRAAAESGAVAPATRAVLDTLVGGPRTTTELRRRSGSDALATLEALEKDGLVNRAEVTRPASARVATVRTAAVAPGVDVEASATSVLGRARKQVDLLRRLAALGETPVGSLTAEFPHASALLRKLEARSLVVLAERRAERDVLGQPLEPDRSVTLTAAQAACLEPIAQAVTARKHETFLLHGVTGSGKTEIYLRAVATALEAGRQALVLVPEITLTHQILARLRGRFGDRLAVLHSGLRPGERLEQWERLRAGETPIAVGARSALFAPIENVGVIVLDEEHDSAYKNDEGFRYHARDLARLRGARSDCPVILGSATPAVDTRFAAEGGAIRRLVLAERIGSRPLPAVEIVDLVREQNLVPRGRRVVLSAPLRRALTQTLADGGQSILFLNRRGFSTTILCFECGAAERCAHCDITLVFHASQQKLCCHYCDYATPPPERCSNCGAPDAALLGIGTERLEEEVRAQYPQATIARLDRDTASKRGHTENVLRGLRDGNIDIVVGTQMVAKGHDFPGVRLVGVIAADVGLHLPDFRAAERTFQVLTQVAGRAGRDVAPGRVIVQTFAPDHYAIQPVVEHDYERFYREELERRSALGYPPFGELIRVVVSGPHEPATQEAAAALAATIAPDASPEAAPDPYAGIEILGPAPAPLARLRDRYRYQLLVKGQPDAALRAAGKKLAAEAARLRAPLQAIVDVRPLSML